MSNRTVLLLAVLACHALLAWLLARAFGLYRITVTPEPALTYVWLPAQADGEAASTRLAPGPAGRARRRQAPMAPRAGPPLPQPRAHDADPDFAGPITLPSTDWRGAAEGAARSALLDQEEATRRAAQLERPARPAPPSAPRDRTLPWQEPRHNLIPKNGLLDVSVDRHGVDLMLFDHCVIHDLLAFGCRFGPKPGGRSDLFDGMQEQLDRRTTAPLP
jgi:hypothetical protein